MEFKFRAVDDRSPTLSSAVSDQIFRGTYPPADLRGIADPIDHRQAIQRQLEKDTVREEIVTAEVARRRALEAEVRMELMMERETVMRRAAEFGLSFEERIAMRFDPRYPFMIPHPVNGWMEAQLPLPATPIQPLPEPNKDKFIFLAKPDPTLYGAKRKAETPPAVGASKPSSSDSTKKPKEWSCALCQVCPTSEKGLNEHLQGKKHKAKAAGLGAERATKKTRKPKPAEATGCEDQAPGIKESFTFKTNGRSSVHNIKDPEEETLRNAEQVKKTSDVKQQKKFKHWCEICKVGAHSDKVMESHKKGKKHVARLQGVGVKETIPASSTKPDSTS